MGKPNFKIDGQPVDAPRNWDALEVLATFDNSGVQANITTDKLNFVNSTAQVITAHINGGNSLTTKGIFEALPLDIEVTEDAVNGLPVTQVFKGVINTPRTRVISPVEVEVEIQDNRGLDKLQFKAEGLTFGLMVDKNFITSVDYVDIPYIVQKKQDLLAEAILALSIYSIAVEIARQIKEVADTISDGIAHATGGVSGTVAAAVWFAAKIIVRIAFIAAMTIQLINLVNNLLEFLAPKIRYFKGMKLRTLLEKGADFMDYSFNSSIARLDDVYLLPSKELEGEIQVFSNPPNNDTGAPRTSDTGYVYIELLEAMQTMFNARFVVKNNDEIHLEPLNNNSFWLQQSTYEKPDVLIEDFEYNTEELSATKLVSFQTDINDQWSLDRFKGTVYEIKTEAIQVGNEQNVLLGGYNESRIPYSLGTRKDDLTKVELSLSNMANVVDQLINFFGGNSNLAGTITQKVGMLRISENLINNPKLLNLTLDAGQLKIPSNHRSTLSAKALWDDYINEQSFVENNFGNQWKRFKGVKVPFTLVDFLKLVQNSYFYDTDGVQSKAEKVSWVIGDDYAILDYRKRFIYTKNLQQRTIESGQNV